VALTPLIVALVRRPGAPATVRGAFSLGLLTGVVSFAGTLYWLVETMTTFGGLPLAVSVFAAALLVAYLALFPAAFAAAMFQLQRTMGVRAALLCAAPVWIATELGRQYVWDGFPWELLGYSQISVLPIAQLASVTGVYGLSGLLVLASAAIAMVIVERGRSRWAMAAMVAVLVAAAAMWGSRRMAGGALTSAGERVRVAVVQGNILQRDKWNPALRDAIIGRYATLTRQAVEQGATFILWPESSLPVYFEEDPIRASVVRRLARDYHVTLLIGSDQVERASPASAVDDPANRYYNAAFLISPDGSTSAIYRKMHLVPFGEYVPLQRLLFFVAPIVEVVSNFTPGREPVLLPVAGHKVSTAICYEVIYGDLMRRFVTDGSELLTTITNDAWYGRSSAAYQHWDQAAMRSIENGRYLARAANTGVSGFVDPYGRALQRTALFEPALVVQDVAFLTGRTVYSRIGDLVAWLSLALTAAALLASRRMRQ
jgi:apolipoprotein N-acyltransferase